MDDQPVREKTKRERANPMTNTTARTAPWPQRFGTLKSVQVKNDRKGRYAIAIATVDCSKFEQVAFVFGDKLVEAGAGAKVWFKGPIEPVERKNAEGRTYTEDQMKIVYFKNNSAAEGSDEGDDQAAGEGAGEAVATTTETAGEPAPKPKRARARKAAAPVAETDTDDIPF